MTAGPDLSSKADQTELQRAWGRDAARLLALLRKEPWSGVTVEAMREQGINAPAQAIYTLQLAGYTIDRVSGAANGHGTPVYRLHRGARDFDGRAPLRDADGSNTA
ncbi:MAG TPA: helix-turn-helix domain-containing protein [Solirubrobacteraceae bacterium]|nr:helix-turn-helix domain-containing protein [Solirubrobacteraceae bacterium]